MAAVDYLSCREGRRRGDVWASSESAAGGGLALNAAALDPRIRATAAVTMYDMARIAAKGYFDDNDAPEDRMAQRRAYAAQRTRDYASGTYERAGGVVDPLPEDAPWFVRDYHDYYKTSRGYHPRSGNSNDGWNVTGTMSFLNQPIMGLRGRDRECRHGGPRRRRALLLHGQGTPSRCCVVRTRSSCSCPVPRTPTSTTAVARTPSPGTRSRDSSRGTCGRRGAYETRGS